VFGCASRPATFAIEERLENVRFLIHDRDTKFSGPFDEVLRGEGVRVIKTPVRAPRANAVAERWVRSVRNECLDHVLVFGRRHLGQILRDDRWDGGDPLAQDSNR
jgi:putative transposase